MAGAPEDALQAALVRAAASNLSMAELRGRYIEAALVVTSGNKSHAAHLLQIDRRSIIRHRAAELAAEAARETETAQPA